ncbi:hypothetical protein AN2V17_32300 [Vallitalea sp. AN17-2]|uniref:Uncharacterized protein n=1 Tax=Vallitalea maricola TaxID=3074433 RepID=A0ACB5UN97_9FIRM|nr:hypothetical protein AN2V17_32300 [Vallitalea sp. AN17-2]
MAIGALEKLEDINIKVPEDISVAGLDNIIFEPSLIIRDSVAKTQ